MGKDVQLDLGLKGGCDAVKKQYDKPMIIFESFSLSTSIAGDCELPYVNNATKGNCGVPDATKQYFVFTDSTTGCNFPGSDDKYEGLCYHVPTEATSLFNS